MKINSIKISSSKDFGIVLARARKARGLSQREVAAQLGVTQKWISAVEQGKPRAWIDKVLELSYFLRIRLFATRADEKPIKHDRSGPSIDDLLSKDL